MEKIKEMFPCKNCFNIFCTRFRIDSGVVCSFVIFMNVVNLQPSLREDLIHCSATARNVVLRTQKQFIVGKTCCYNIFFLFWHFNMFLVPFSFHTKKIVCVRITLCFVLFVVAQISLVNEQLTQI